MTDNVEIWGVVKQIEAALEITDAKIDTLNDKLNKLLKWAEE